MRAGQSGAHPKTERPSRQFFAGSPLCTEYSSIVFFSSFELSTRRDWCAACEWDSGGVTAAGRCLSSFSLTDSFLLFLTLSACAHQPSSMGLPFEARR